MPARMARRRSGVALLLAPKAGRDLRQDIRAKIRRGKAEGEVKSPDGANQAPETA